MNWDKVLNELSYRVDKGHPDLNDPIHIATLQSILLEQGWEVDAIAEFISNLHEKPEDDKVKFHPGPKTDAGTSRFYFVDGQEELHLVTKEYGTKKAWEPADKNDIATKKPAEDGGGKAPEKEEPKDTEQEKPKSDGGQLVHGSPDEGDNQVKIDAFKYGNEDFEKETGSKPAPGGAGSMFNEIASGEGVHILSENPDMSVEQLSMEMFNRWKDTALAKEQKVTRGILASEIPDSLTVKKRKGKLYNSDGEELSKDEAESKLQSKDFYTKCLVSARSAKKKYDRTASRINKLQQSDKFGKSHKVYTFYGAQDSLDGQVDLVKSAKNVLLPSGVLVSKDDAIEFIKAGGRGANPSDTATFASDTDGNLLMQFHSDKTTTNDIQDNSTLTAEGDNYKQSIVKQENLTDKEKEWASNLIDEYAGKMNEIEEHYNKQSVVIAKNLFKYSLEDQLDIVEKETGTLKKNMDKALFGPSMEPPTKLTKSNPFYVYQNYMPKGKKPKELTYAEKYQMIRKAVADGRASTNDVKAINKVSMALKKQNPDLKGIDVKKNLSIQREKVVRLQRERVDKLNKVSIDVDGVDVPLGRLMEAEETIRGFHLILMDYPPRKYEEGKPGTMVGSSLDVNMGGNIVNGEVLRECLGVNNTTDFKKKFKLEETDELQYQAGHGPDSPNPIVTGKVVYTYVVDLEDKRILVGSKVYRSKQGATGRTSNTMSYSKQMQDCFKSK